MESQVEMLNFIHFDCEQAKRNREWRELDVYRQINSWNSTVSRTLIFAFHTNSQQSSNLKCDKR